MGLGLSNLCKLLYLLYIAGCGRDASHPSGTNPPGGRGEGRTPAAQSDWRDPRQPARLQDEHQQRTHVRYDKSDIQLANYIH